MNRFLTSIAIDASDRQKIVDVLNDSMATAIDLRSQVKQAHWNIKGPQFVSRHMLFDDLAAHLRDWSDELAERVSTLGGYAYGTARCVAERSKIAEYNLGAVDGKAHVQALVSGYASFGALLRSQLAAVEALEEPVTIDLLTETLRGVEKDLWFLESHLNT